MSSKSASDPTGTGGLLAAGAAIMEDHWRPKGFTCPNSTTYPWLWLWDSCFHSIIWADLGNPDRAILELRTALSSIDPDGFVPHLAYLDGSDGHSDFWGRGRTSSITQPPIYGHVVAELTRRGIDVPADLQAQSGNGLRFLLQQRQRSEAGLIELVHPWESGCDDSPRWDDLMAPESSADGPDPYGKDRWFARKGELLGSIRRSGSGAPLSNPEFSVGSVAFSAITAFCASELASVTGDVELAELGRDLADRLSGRWSPNLRTWVDDGATADGSGSTRTLEGLLPLLVETDQTVIAAVCDDLTDPGAYAGEFGLWQVHVEEPRFTRGSYWRGPGWPQLDYLMWLALGRAGRTDLADDLAERTRRGADVSGFAEYWDADTAGPGGAVPQSWAVLAVCMGHLPTPGT